MSFDGVTNLEIQNVEDLKTFRDMVNAGTNFAGKTITLKADIDLNNEAWTPIGTGASFKGVFDGNGYKVSNLNVNRPGQWNCGFFGETYGAEIKNLTIENATVVGGHATAVVVGYASYNKEFTNVKVTGHVVVEGTNDAWYVGGVVGRNFYGGNMENVTVDVYDTSSISGFSYVGGIIGWCAEGSYKYENLYANIDVKGDYRGVGGISGIGHYGNTFENVKYENGNVVMNGEDNEGSVGGVIGVWLNTDPKSNVYMVDCTVGDDVTVIENDKDVTKDKSIAGDSWENQDVKTGGSLLVANKTTDANGNETVQYSVTGGSEDSAKKALKNFIDAVEGAGSSAGYNIDSQKYNEETGSIDLITASSDEVLIGKGDETGYHEGQLVVDDGSTYVAKAIKFSQSSENSAFRNGSALDVETLSIGNTYVVTNLDSNHVYLISFAPEDDGTGVSGEGVKYVDVTGKTYFDFFTTLDNSTGYVCSVIDTTDPLKSKAFTNITVQNAVLTVDYTSTLNFSVLNAAKETIYIDMTGYDAVDADKTNRILNFKGTGMTLEEYEVVVQGDDFLTAGRTDGAIFVEANGDLYVTDKDQSYVYVNTTFDEESALDRNLILNYNAFTTLADAAKKVSANGTICVEGDATTPISSKADVIKDMTITGNAYFDWSKGWLYIGRVSSGEAADATLTIKDAVIGSVSNNASYGFHVSSAEKGDAKKANGELIITNSQVEVDYMINRNKVVVNGDGDHTNYDLYVKNGFSVSGRPASESVSGKDTLAVTEINGGYVKIDNMNGMGIGYAAADGNGELNIHDKGKFEVLKGFVNGTKGEIKVDGSEFVVNGKFTNSGTVTAAKSTLNIGTLDNSKIVKIDDSTVTADKLNNNGLFNVTGESTLDIDAVTGNINLGATDKNTTVTFKDVKGGNLVLNDGSKEIWLKGNFDGGDDSEISNAVNKYGSEGTPAAGTKVWVAGDMKAQAVYVSQNSEVIVTDGGKLTALNDAGTEGNINVYGGTLTVKSGTAATANANVVGTVNVAGGRFEAGAIAIAQGKGNQISGVMNVTDNGTVYMKNGSIVVGVEDFGDKRYAVGTKPSAEAILNINKGTVELAVNDRDNRGLTVNAGGVVSVKDGAIKIGTAEYSNNGYLENYGHVKMIDSTLEADIVKNHKYFDVYGNAKLNIGALEGRITVADATIMNGSVIGTADAPAGCVDIIGDEVNFDGVVTLNTAVNANIKKGGNSVATSINIKKDADITWNTKQYNDGTYSGGFNTDSSDKLNVYGKLTISGDNVYLKAETLVEKGAEFIIDDAGFQNTYGKLTVKGAMTIKDRELAYQNIKLAGNDNATTTGELDVDGGTLTIDGPSFAFGGGFKSSGWVDATKATVKVQNGGTITANSNVFRNGVNSTLTLNNGTFEFTDAPEFGTVHTTLGTAIDNYGKIIAENGSTLDFGNRTFENYKEIVIKGSKFTAGKVSNDGTIGMDWMSDLTMGEFDGNAITVDATGFAANKLEKVIDMTGTDAIADTEYSIVNGTDVKGIIYKGDLYLSTVDTSTIYLNKTYADSDDAFGTEYAPGIYGGVNAFDTFAEALNAGSKIDISDDGVITEAGTVTIGKTKTVDLSGEGTIRTTGYGLGLDGTLNVATGSDIAFEHTGNYYALTINTTGNMYIAQNAEVDVNMFLVKGNATVDGGTLNVGAKDFKLSGSKAALTATNGAVITIAKDAIIGSTGTGSAVVIDGSTLTAENGKFTVNAGSSLTVKGASTINVTNAAVAGTINVVGATLSSSTLNATGAGKLFFGGNNTLTGSDISFAGDVEIEGDLSVVNDSTLTVGTVIFSNIATYTGAAFDTKGTVYIYDTNGNIIASEANVEIKGGSFTLNDIDYIAGGRLPAGEYSFAFVDPTDDNKIIPNGTITFEAGTLTVDLGSMVEYTGSIDGKVTLDAAGFTGNYYKFVDYTGTGAADLTIADIVVKNGDTSKLFTAGGDIFYGEVAQDYFYVNGAWAGSQEGDIVAGHIYGINASDSFIDNSCAEYKVVGNTTVAGTLDVDKNIVIDNCTLAVGSLSSKVSMSVGSVIEWTDSLAGSKVTFDWTGIGTEAIKLFDYNGTDASAITEATYQAIIKSDWNNAYYVDVDGDLWFKLSEATKTQALGGVVTDLGTDLVEMVNKTTTEYVGGANITVTGLVAGGEVVSVAEGWYYRTGNINTIVNGGTFNRRVYGGMYKNNDSALNVITLKGDINTTINGGTFKDEVYGGHGLYDEDVASITQQGNINLTIDSSNNAIAFESTLIAGSLGTCVLQGNINVTIKGDNDVTMKQLWGSNAGGYYREPVTDNAEMDYHNVTGTRTLAFDDFSGDFTSGAIVGFQKVTIKDSTVDFAGVGAMYETTGWEMDWNSEISNFDKHNFDGDTLAIDLTGWTNDKQTLISGESVDSLLELDDLTIGGVNATLTGNVWLAGNYKFTIDTDKNTAVLTLA